MQVKIHVPCTDFSTPLTRLVQGFFKGTSADQDRRFSDKELKLLKSIKFPPEFDKKVSHLSPLQTNNLLIIFRWT